MNSWAQGEGQPGLGYIFWREGEEGGAGPRREELSGPSEQPSNQVPTRDCKDGDAVFFVAGNPANFYKFAGLARDRVGHELKLVEGRPVRARVDRRLPVLRMERGRQEDRLLAQPVLDAARRRRSA